MPIDYTTTKFEEVAKDVDVVLDTVGGDTLKRTYAVVKKAGSSAHCATVLIPPNWRSAASAVRRWRCSRMQKISTEIGKLIEAGKIKPVVSQVLPLTAAAKAHEQMATLHTRGKIVLKVAAE